MHMFLAAAGMHLLAEDLTASEIRHGRDRGPCSSPLRRLFWWGLSIFRYWPAYALFPLAVGFHGEDALKRANPAGPSGRPDLRAIFCCGGLSIHHHHTL